MVGIVVTSGEVSAIPDVTGFTTAALTIINGLVVYTLGLIGREEAVRAVIAAVIDQRAAACSRNVTGCTVSAVLIVQCFNDVVIGVDISFVMTGDTYRIGSNSQLTDMGDIMDPWCRFVGMAIQTMNLKLRVFIDDGGINNLLNGCAGWIVAVDITGGVVAITAVT